MSNDSLCICGSGLETDACCSVYHSGEKAPLTAEQMMRSRFTAYALGNTDYMLETWDSSKRPEQIDLSKEENVQWTHLEIIDTKKGGISDNKGLVEFKAFYTLNDEEYAMHEISRFVKKNKHWYYLDGQVKSVGKVNQQVNLGRNALCSCGSGKKYKRCCGK